MNAKLLIIRSALCLFGLGLLGMPVRAGDAAARAAVKQSFLAMGSVHSYRDKWFIRDADSKDAFVTSITEATESPRVEHNFFTMGSDKTETITTTTTLYTHQASGQWKAETLSRPLAKSCGQAWLKYYDSAATYRLVRHEVLASVPMNVYTCASVRGKGRRVRMIWIGVKNHLPYQVSTRDLDAHGAVRATSVETFSDYNAPIKITIPSVPH